MSTTPTRSGRTANAIFKAAVFSEHLQPKLTTLLIAVNEVLQAAKTAMVQTSSTDITPIQENNQ